MRKNCNDMVTLPGLQLIHLKIPRLFPDILQFSIPLTDQKEIFILYFSANCITSNLGVTIKRKNLLPRDSVL